MAWITPKLNWVITDYINHPDWNRIENNINEVRNYLNSISCPMPALTVITNRDKNSIDFLSSINRIEQNIEAIKINFMTPPGYQNTKVWSGGKGFDFNDSNRLENNVKLLMDYGVLAYQSFRYCGVAICGEQGVIY